MKMKNYRRDIDGLRAIAVLSVLIYHFDAHLLPGGFVGVDLFFVISGFLITGILINASEVGNFSFSKFYANRVIRIFPALLLVLFVTLLIGYFTLLKDEAVQLGKHLTSAALFISNFRLLRESSYFDSASYTKPLLHLWSLAIEEQFYIFWPILIYFLGRTKLKKLTVFAALIVTSFLSNLWILGHSPSAAFYLPQSRFWEIGLGGIMACLDPFIQSKRISYSKLPNFLSTLGISLVFISLFFIDHNSRFPGFLALIPCFGAIFLISAGNQSYINLNFLGNKLLVSIGLISYPLYLWHWPLLSYVQIIKNGNASLELRGLMIVLAFALSFLTYVSLEKPFRFGINPKFHKVKILTSGMLVLFVLGTLAAHNFLHARLDQKHFAQILEAKDDWDFWPPTLDHGEVVTHQLNGTSKNNIVFLGDSHMEQYWPRFKAIYSNKPQQYKAIFATYDGCPSIATGNKECDAIFMSALKAASNDETKKVVFASYWEASLKNKGVELDKILQHFEHLVQTLKNQGKIPIIVLSNPTGSEFNPRNLINRFTKDPTVIEERFVSRSQFEVSANPVLGKLKELAIRNHVEWIDPLDFLCDSNGRCNVMENGNPKYKDDDHIRAQYSKDKIKYLDHVLR